MAEGVKPIPDGVSVVIPRLFCREPEVELRFCTAALGAIERNVRPGPDGKTAHALITIGPAMVMIEGEWPELLNRAPPLDGSSPVVLYVYVENVDDVAHRAEAAGARVLMAPTNQFWGDRTAWIVDPSGHVWTLATRVEESSEDERQARLADLQATRTSTGT